MSILARPAIAAGAAALVLLAAPVGLAFWSPEGGLFGEISTPASFFFVLPLLGGKQDTVVPLLVIAALAVPLAFIVWAPRLFRGSADLPPRTLVLIAVVALASIAYYGLRWDEALGDVDQGPLYLWLCVGMNVILGATSLLLALRTRRMPSYHANLAAHTATFLWLSTFAFPILGALSD